MNHMAITEIIKVKGHQMIDIIGASPHIVILEYIDIDTPPKGTGCWTSVDILLLPESDVQRYFKSELYMSMMPCLSLKAKVITYFKDSKNTFHTTNTYTTKQFAKLRK